MAASRSSSAGRKSTTGKKRRRTTTSSGTSKRKTSGRKSSQSSRKKTTAKRSARRQENPELISEILSFLCFCFVIVVALCMLGVIGGGFGPAIKSIMTGLFGLFGYLLPFILMAYMAWKALFDGDGNTRQSVGAILFLFAVGMLLSYVRDMSLDTISDMSSGKIQALYEVKDGGGLIFGLPALWMYKIFGTVGGIFVSAILLLVAIFLFTGSTYVREISGAADHVRQGARRKKRLKMERREARREAEEEFLSGMDYPTEEELEEERRRVREERRREVLNRARQEEADHIRMEEEELRREEERTRRREDQARRDEAQRTQEDRARHKEEEKRKRLEKEEQEEEERILNASRPEPVRRRESARPKEDMPSRDHSVDDMHEITLRVRRRPERTVEDTASVLTAGVGAAASFAGEAVAVASSFAGAGAAEAMKAESAAVSSGSWDSDGDFQVETDISSLFKDNSMEGDLPVTGEVFPEEELSVSEEESREEVLPPAEEDPVEETETVPGPVMTEPDTDEPVIEKAAIENSAGEVLPVDISGMPDPVTERTHGGHMDERSEEETDIPAGATPGVKASEVKTPAKKAGKYVKPSLELLSANTRKKDGDSDEYLKETALTLQQTLKSFGVSANVINISQGPSVTRFELQMAEGTKVSKILGLADDLKLNLAAEDIRIEAPIPGKKAVGIEIPNKESIPVLIRDLLESREFEKAASKTAYAVGKDISGPTIVSDIAKMPHLLVAGATGSGKSVFINTLIMSILYKAAPDEVKFIMIDPKMVELNVYNGIPHLLLPVVTDPRQANAALSWAVGEMTKRYKLFAEHHVRGLQAYNELVEKGRIEPEEGEDQVSKLPLIVLIVDELADLMMVASKDVEASICRLAQLARAAGIHLVIATQRPSVDVITGLIKANMPSRIALKVSSGVDSRTILDTVGAERLLGRGDMLFAPQNYPKPLRVQGAWISDEEVEQVATFLRENAGDDVYDEEVVNSINSLSKNEDDSSSEDNGDGKGNEPRDELDSYFEEACRLVVGKEKASSGMLQRVFKIGYNRAARIVDQMEANGVVGPDEGTKPRRVLMSETALEEFLKARKEYESV